MNSPTKERIYLDANASAPLCDEARDAMLAHLHGAAQNPSSVHAEGREGRAALARARRQVAAAIGADPSDLVLTSSATEANNLALKGLCVRSSAKHRNGLVTTTAEHPSVLEPLRWLARGPGGLVLDEVPVNESGGVALETLANRVDAQTLLVSVIAANNETGAVSPVAEIAEMVHQAGGLLHVDAAQALGRIPVSVGDWGADMVTISSHKAGGPRGAGALWIRAGLEVDPVLHGGHQERNRRGGTESVLSHVGFGAAAEVAVSRRSEMGDRVGPLRDRLWSGLSERLGDARRLSPQGSCLPNTLLVAFPGVAGDALLMGLDMAGIAVSTGSACTAGSLEPSHVLLAMGVDEATARTAVRFSLGLWTDAQDIERTIDSLSELVPRLRGSQ